MNTADISLQPKAPKDPVKKSQAYYMMRNKDVAASPTEDGKGVQAVYLDMGRLIFASKLVGGIEDETELDLLKTTEGFRKLVHQIGVSIETEDYNTDVTFCFQMYGKTDKYVTGTTIEKKIKGDGAEALINLEEVNWSDDDVEPGQLRFEFPKDGMTGSASVKFYLNEGYSAPVPEEEPPVKTDSAEYIEMISHSVTKTGNNFRLKKAISKARAGDDVTIAFIGGSITQGAGAVPINTGCYAYKAFKGFCDLTGKGTDENIHYVKAGVGGTPSELGMIRYEADVLDNGKITPDIVIVEFAVNDAGDETGGRCYDSLVRKIYDGPGKPAVILLFAVFQDDFNLEERLSPVGEAYNLPMVSTKQCVTNQFYKKPGQGRVVSKNQFFYDCFHPTNMGHTIMADGLKLLFKMTDEAPCDGEMATLSDITAPIGGQFEMVSLIDRKTENPDAVISAGNFTETDNAIQMVERNMDLGGSPEFPNNWMYTGGDNVPFTIDVNCKSLLIVYKDSESINDGIAEVWADGELKLTINPRDVGWTHANAYIVFESEETSRHHVEVKMKDGYEDKRFTILGFGIVR